MSEGDDPGRYEEGGDVLPFPTDRVPREDESSEETDGLDSLTNGSSALDDFTHEDYVSATTREYQGLAEAISEAERQDHEMAAVAATMPGLETGLVGFEDVTGEVEPVDLPDEPRSDLANRVITAVVLLVVVGSALFAGGGWLMLLVGALSIIGIVEFYTALRRVGYVPLSLFGLLGAIGALVGAWVSGPIAAAGFAATTAVAILLWYSLLVRRNPLDNAALTMLGVLWIPVMFSFAAPIAHHPNHRPLILAVVIATGVLDMGSFFIGKRWGRHKLAPELSPNKTIEGLVGGIVTGGVATVLLTFIPWFEPLDWKAGFGLAGVVAVFGPLGDLAESLIKRSVGIKDMGSILPGHGGVLDRVDAFLFTIPAAYFFFRLAGFLA
ncbi:MAG TPA: phosphatidate cytidylyltransferase [Acidimicrobiia bacterium]|nr:phosphatidate cytidylyltransferase [Acidimicrobiia bacterium]